jgi:hypothetical protein
MNRCSMSCRQMMIRLSHRWMNRHHPIHSSCRRSSHCRSIRQMIRHSMSRYLMSRRHPIHWSYRRSCHCRSIHRSFRRMSHH